MAAQNSKKRILVMTNHSYMLWQFRRELIMELLKNNAVYLCMPYVGHEEDFRNLGAKCIRVELERRGTNPFKDLKLLSVYDAVIRKVKPDFVITYSIKPNIYGGLVCRRRKIPYYANVQGLGTAFQNRKTAPIVSLFYKEGIKGADKVFFENEENALEFRKRGIVSEQQQVVLHGAGVNLSYFSYVPYPANDIFHFLYLGRIMREKGVEELFFAAEKLREEEQKKSEETRKKFVLDIVGFFEEPYEERVKHLEEKGIVKFHGFQTDPRPFYQSSDCVVMPSYHEGMSNVNLEAAATGRPVIATDIPGCREAIEEGMSGLLCRKADSESLLERMRQMLDMSKELREDMGKKACLKMKMEFDRRKIVEETCSYFEGSKD